MQIRCGEAVWETPLPFAVWRKFASLRGCEYESWEEGSYVVVLRDRDNNHNKSLNGNLLTDFR